MELDIECLQKNERKQASCTFATGFGRSGSVASVELLETFEPAMSPFALRVLEQELSAANLSTPPTSHSSNYRIGIAC